MVARLEPWALQLVPPGEGALAAAVESWDSPGQVDGWNSVKTDPSSLGGLSKSALLKRASSVVRSNMPRCGAAIWIVFVLLFLRR